MYVLSKKHKWKPLLTTEAPSLICSIVIAELFFKWHSFTLECLGFLATWYCLSALVHVVLSWLASRTSKTNAAG